MPISVPTRAAIIGIEYALPLSLGAKVAVKIGFAVAVIIAAPRPMKPLNKIKKYMSGDTAARPEATVIKTAPPIKMGA